VKKTERQKVYIRIDQNQGSPDECDALLPPVSGVLLELVWQWSSRYAQSHHDGSLEWESDSIETCVLFRRTNFQITNFLGVEMNKRRNHQGEQERTDERSKER
jgi:hypothetical protein